jgi:tripartite-type tricarboxylate transporter receptor subunit TctC
MNIRRICSAVGLAATIAGGLAPVSAVAQSSDAIADFYHGKQVRMIIRSAPGGGYDLYSRLLARSIGNHIPGKPMVIPQNMPGAGGLVAINYVAEVAPRDGTIITLISSSLVLDQALGLTPTLVADLRTLNWIGNLLDSNVLTYVWHEFPVKTMDDARRIETLIGSTGTGDISSWIPEVYNKVLGTKFKVIEGYRASADTKLAMERGEVAGIGSNPLASLMAATPDWLRDKKVSVLVQIGLRREALLPDVPLLTELGRTDEEREILGFISKAIAIGRPFGTTPEVPKERVEALRKAFDDTVVDPAFLADAQKQGAEVGPTSGAVVQGLIADVLGAPPELKAKVKAVMPPRT